ncbi:hypothetical protein [Micromonospora avicenniae]|uniref:Uncharacterized protein n=1 Tax=Micromonospora avicenniae TaxID=1198245 RepID=A0A1N7FTC1_9ACTN|nr:hypothetical protein [Micromonospora avicenniae]SIS03603.1 hypothetical protein SAMN05444858_1486 [Micromonospora avicenniae]
MTKRQEEPEFDCVVATEWGYSRQQLWTRLSPDAWISEGSPGYLSWEELLELGEVAILTPADQDAYQVGRRDGRFEVLREVDASLRKIGEATYKIGRS